LYGMAARDPEMAHALCDAADVFKVPLMGMVGTLHETIFTQRGHEFISEFYTDLDYGDQGDLVITREHHAVEPAEAAARSVRAVASRRDGLQIRRACQRKRNRRAGRQGRAAAGRTRSGATAGHQVPR